MLDYVTMKSWQEIHSFAIGAGSGGCSGVIMLQLGEIMLLQDDTGDGSGEGKGETLHTICSQVSFPELCRTTGDDT